MVAVQPSGESDDGSRQSALGLIGRQREQALLRDQLDRARSGSGSLVLVSGEAGIGKTALTLGLAGVAASNGLVVATGRCYDLVDTSPYGPWLEVLAGLGIDRAAPAISGSLSDGDSNPRAPDLARERESTYSQIIDSLTSLVAGGASSDKAALLLILDDLHWADNASLELLRRLARRLAQLPILVVATYRGDELSSGHPLYTTLPLLIRESQAVRIELRGLDATDLREIARESYSLTANDEARLVHYLVERSDGNPLFASELLRTLEEEGRLARTDAAASVEDDSAGWQLGRLDDLSVPGLLMQVIDRRLARLSDEAQQALAVAAVIGDEVSLELWTRVLDSDEAALLPVIEQAIAARIVDAGASGLTVSFTHTLYRQALYLRTLPPRRRSWHRLIAERLVESGADAVDIIANHLERAGDPRASGWLIRAGERAQASYALLTAAERFEAALTAIELRGGSAAERAILRYRIARMRRYADPAEAIAYFDDALPLARDAGDQLLCGYIMGSRGQLHCSTGAIRQGIAEMEQGLALLEDLSPDEAERLPALQRQLGEPAGAHDFRGALTSWYGLTGRYVAARETGNLVIERSTEPSMRGSGTSALANAWNGIGLTEAALARPFEAQVAFEQAIASYQSARHWYQVGNALMLELTEVVLPFRADDLARREELAGAAEAAWSRASGALDELPVRIARLPLMVLEGEWNGAVSLAGTLLRAERPAWRAFATTALVHLYHFRGDDAAAERLMREELPAGSETAPGNAILSDALPLARLAAGIAQSKRDEASAVRWLEMHDAWLAGSGNQRDLPSAELAWAMLHLRTGRLAEADRYARRALELAMSPRRPLMLLEGHRLLGEIQLAARRWTAAIAEFELALAAADACVARFERARVLLGLGSAYRGLDVLAEAAARASEALATFERLGAKPLLAETERLLSEIELGPGN
ncbi:MAG TPA: AAA family ATPase, partial [Thermomicrobiaceae bacterium]|nr:AAA family ATPase [Thermomicrobiaceae bacterium]